MNLVRIIHELRAAVGHQKRNGKRVGFVPTMGALHAGHVSLVRLSKAQADITVVSIFVNPAQFGPDEDFQNYPRTLEDDLKILEAEGTDIVFIPLQSEMYVEKRFLNFTIDGLGQHMEGNTRPGHFEGVLLIVSKLFNAAKPDMAFFGQKDIQQFKLIDRLITELNYDIRLVMGETVREEDGVALSSRNRYMTPENRKIAPVLYRVLSGIKTALCENPRSVDQLVAQGKQEFVDEGARTDYLMVASYETMQPVTSVETPGRYVIGGAIHLGSTRILDNVIFEVPDPAEN